jgi:ribonuclease HI
MCSCAFVALTEKGELIHQQGFYLGPEIHTNNYAEYMGVINALEWVADSYPPLTSWNCSAYTL